MRSHKGFGTSLVAPFDLPAPHIQALYIVTRMEQARDKRIAAFER